MACYFPLQAYRSRSQKTINGKPLIKFGGDPHFHADSEPLNLPCGQCIGCRLERSRQWAIRCVHESMLHSQNSFITLTFSPEFLETRPNEWSLDKRDFQLFMKRLRKKFGQNIRYYHCGEYGEMCAKCNLSLFKCNCQEPIKMLGRPHYHACFGDLMNFFVGEIKTK